MDYVYTGCLDLHPHSTNNPEQVSTKLYDISLQIVLRSLERHVAVFSSGSHGNLALTSTLGQLHYRRILLQCAS